MTDFNPFEQGPTNEFGQNSTSRNGVYRGDEDPFASAVESDVFSDASVTAATSKNQNSLLSATGGAVLETQSSSGVNKMESKPYVEIKVDAQSNTTSSETAKPNANQEVPPRGACWCLTPAVLQPHFNVDTVDVYSRLLHALWPFNRDATFLERTDLNNDLYGPFWLSTTLIFLMGAMGNIVGWLKFESGGGVAEIAWSYDFRLVTYASMVCYGYIIALPLLLIGASYALSFPLRLPQMLCLYGYSLVHFIPAALLSVVPLDWFEWLAMLVACGFSGAFLFLDLWPKLREGNTVRAFPAMITILVIHFAFSLAMKLFFF